MILTKHRADRVVLSNISWQQFENLLVDLGESRAARIAYDDGTLESMTPLPEHEYYQEILSIAIQDIAEVLELDYESLGSTTWKREIKKAGVEPDNCFYFQNEAMIRGKLEFDLNHDPPPDLALEAELKMAITIGYLCDADRPRWDLSAIGWTVEWMRRSLNYYRSLKTMPSWELCYK
jgi:Uma2 family endonuclease